MAMRWVAALVVALAWALPAAGQEQRSPWGGPDSPGGLFGGGLFDGRPAEADTDRDGRLTHDEVWSWLRQRFDQADRNGDGRLSAQEVPSHRRAQSTFRAADADRNGHVTPEELRPLSEMWFRSLDANGDNALTGREMPRRRPTRPASP
ncbi:hypothetical protein JYK14_15585 [Siccirubricoccus sp. KC 17139]|uniref:EF-hand domain-containing protein n=1 Tax=Siccirubricoccus soli TaxID=2899147 RepID=A0ABT1D6P2_9PROT|nr:hypothetical protein [Siccirubricoccus soli]MCO6417571.1 hypothetical protein [Siccirubricoccus soli]MCP2683706.1 hypothetical protein [Siccirubricoccus soli]